MISKITENPNEAIDCGDSEINDFFRNQVIDSFETGICVSYGYSIRDQTVGFVTTSMSKLFTELNGLSFNFPSVLLGQMGVDRTHQGRNIGRRLVKYVLGLANNLKENIGCRLVILEVKKVENSATGDLESNNELINWYKRLGFEVSKLQNKRTTDFLYFDLNS